MNNYPQCLVEELARLGEVPTYNLEWDRAMLRTLRSRQRDDVWTQSIRAHSVVNQARKDSEKAAKAYPDLSDPVVFDTHMRAFLYIADNIVLAPQKRRFVVDDDNRNILRFLLYYFNNCPLAETVFPGRGYKLHKNILLQGGVGVGKTMLMQCFSEYLRRFKNPRFFWNLSVTQMVNYYTMHNNLDRFTFCEEGSTGFLCKPENVCLNDIGLAGRIFYGMNTEVLTDEFLHARNDIWANYDKFAHLTTNLDIDQLKARFSKDDKHGRLIDRFKTYNVIPMPGKSRR